MLPDVLVQDLRYAFRALRASPGFAAVSILSLALGIGANTAIFSLIDAVMLKYLPVNHPEQLLQVISSDEFTWISNPVWEQLRDRQDVFSGILAYGPNRYNLSGGGEARYVAGVLVSGSYFSTLGVQPVLGRAFTASDDQRGCAATAVLSYDFWQREYGGSGDVLGKTISLDGRPFQIMGVIEPGFTGVDVGNAMQVYAPICAEPILLGERSVLDRSNAYWLRVVARPKPGVSPKQATARLKTLAPEIFATTMPKNYLRADLRERYLQRTFETVPAANGLSQLRVQYRPALLTLMVIVGIVLLIACANVANLLLARATVRQKEIAIRLALGSGRGRLIRQLLTESLVLSIAGAALGVLFAQWGSRLLVTFLSTSRGNVVLDLTVDVRVLVFTAAIATATGVLFGMAPAWRSTRVSPQAAMKANSRGITQDRSRFGLGKALVMLQVALSLVLLVGAGLMAGTFHKLETLDPGFERDHVLIVELDARTVNEQPERRAAVYEELLKLLQTMPGVRSASLSENTPISGLAWNQDIVVPGYVPQGRTDSVAWFYSCYPKFFETLGIQLVAGRDFDDRDQLNSPKVALINETMARKFFGAANPVGKIYQRRGTGNTLDPPVEIVGVVKDVKYRSLRENIPPTVYVAMRQDFTRFTPDAVFELRAGGPATDLIPGVKTIMEQMNRNTVISFHTLSAQVDESLNRERLLATLSGFFGVLALLLAAIGLYGVMSYNVARRRGEIGIRMALGAEQAMVLRMVLGEVTLVVAVGLIAGLAVALAATRLIDSFLYGLNPRDPGTIALAAGVLTAVAVLAGYVPARRASRLDPMSALREE